MAETAVAPQEDGSGAKTDGKGLGSIIQTLTQSVTITVALLYGIGLLVTNTYLASVGAQDFNLFRTKCVITGVWAGAILVMVSLPGLVALSVASQETFTRKDIELIIATAILGAIFASSIGSVFGVIPSWKIAWIYPAGVLMFMFPMASYSLLAFIKSRDKRPSIKPGRPSIWGAVMLFSFCLVAATVCLGKFVYPKVYTSLGGGRPLKAKLILTHEGVLTWKQFPSTVDYDALAKQAGATAPSIPPPESGPMITGDVEILYENEQQIVIKWKSQDPGSIVALDKKLVSAVIPTEREL